MIDDIWRCRSVRESGFMSVAVSIPGKEGSLFAVMANSISTDRHTWDVVTYVQIRQETARV